MEKVLMVYNPTSGKDSARKKPDEIIRVFKENGFTITEKTTTCVGDATEIVKHHLGDHDLVACCGGDGTFNEAVNGMMSLNSPKPLMYIPMGTTNDLANTIGVTKDIEKQISLYKKGYVNSYDIGDFNGNYFNYVASFGVATDASYVTSQKFKNLFGYAAYRINGFVLRLPHYIKTLRSYHLKLEYDGGVIEDDFYFGAISNTNVVANLFKYDKLGIKLNDGVFECLFVRGVKGAADAFHLLKKIVDQNYDGTQIITFSTSKLKITGTDETAWTLDGEFGGNHKNIDISVNPGAINIVSPPSKYFITDKEPYKEDERVFTDDDLQKRRPDIQKKKS